MKRGLKAIAAGIAALAAGTAGLASAETVLSVTQISYDYENHPVCTAVRMNPAIYGALPSDACTLGTASATYGNDRITVNSYDAAGELVQVTQAYGTSDQRVYSTFSYSNNGKVVDSIDANGNRSHNVYDGFDRLTTVYYPSTTRPSAYNPSSQANALATAGAYNSSDYESYGYDANDNRTSWRRRDGQTISYTYDNLNQETMSDPPGTALDIYTGYDGLGHVLYKRFGSTSGAGVSYAYDGLGRVTSTTDMNGRTLSYQYNQASARTRLTYPDSVYIGYGLDNANRVASIGYNMYSDLTAQTYDSLGQLISIARNGGSTSYGYDALGRLTSMTNDLSGTTYDVTWSFAYNPSSQIYTSSASSTVYDYKETASSTVNQTYDGLNRDAAIAAMSGGYDARGNMTSDGARSFSYDIYNRLLTATGGSAALTLTYDPEGRLASYTSGSTVTQFLYDGVNLVGEYDGSGNVLRRYIHGTGTDNPLVWFEGSGASDYRPIYTDYHGSVIAYTDASGNLQDLYKYGPYGEPKNGSNVESWSGLRFRYTGQFILPEAKLYYYKARVYDPVYGRFLQTDPIGSKDDLDLYAYTGDDPVNGTDTSGTEAAHGFFDEGCGDALFCTTIVGGNHGAKLAAQTGAVLGGSIGVVAAGGCDVGTDGLCVLGNVAIVGGASAAGAATGLAIYNTVSKLPDLTRSVVDTLHGNDLRSRRITYMYTLIERDHGFVMKYGITSNPVPMRRYSAGFYKSTNTQMVNIRQFPTRSAARDAELTAVWQYAVTHNYTLPPMSLIP